MGEVSSEQPVCDTTGQDDQSQAAESRSLTSKSDSNEHDIVHAIREIRSNPPTGLEAMIATLEPVIDQVRKKLVVELNSVINLYEGGKIGDLAEKRRIAKRFNNLIDSLGLSLRCPKTGLDATLVARPRGDGFGNGRFEIHASGSTTGTSYSPELPRLELIVKDVNRQRKTGKIVI